MKYQCSENQHLRLPDETYQRPQTKPRFQVEGKRAGHRQSAKTAATQSIYKEMKTWLLPELLEPGPTLNATKREMKKRK